MVIYPRVVIINPYMMKDSSFVLTLMLYGCFHYQVSNSGTTIFSTAWYCVVSARRLVSSTSHCLHEMFIKYNYYYSVPDYGYQYESQFNLISLYLSVSHIFVYILRNTHVYTPAHVVVPLHIVLCLLPDGIESSI